MSLEFGTLWFGKPHTLIQTISWASFPYYGHKLNVYLYDMSIEIPKGCIKRDANEIMPESSIFLPKVDTGEGHAQFADFFRINMIKKTNTIWVDSDVICLKEKWPEHKPYLFGDQFFDPFFFGPYYLNNDVLYIQDSKLLDELLEKMKEPPSSYAHSAIMAGDLLTSLVRKNKLEEYILPEYVFHPINWHHADYFIRPDKFNLAMDMIKNSTAVSLWNSSWYSHNIIELLKDDLGENTVLGYFAKKFGVK